MQTSKPNKNHPGPIVLFGSGETSPQGRKVFEYILRSLPSPPRIALVETPAGFELNSDRVMSRIEEFLVHHLQNYEPQISIIPARKRGTYYSPDNPNILRPLLNADLIFMGPGSPTYAVRQLRESLAWEISIARHRMGSALILASAATIAISSCALPVYEIYKVGEDLHWKEGLRLFEMYGLSLVCIPHWNNNDGGADLDTSRCFMGQSRFITLMGMLPLETTIIGIDELTALIIEPDNGECSAIGNGGVTLIKKELSQTGDIRYWDQKSPFPDENDEDHSSYMRTYREGETFELSELGPLHMDNLETRISKEVWKQVLEAHQNRYRDDIEEDEKPPEKIIQLVEERNNARARREWEKADKLRDDIAALGWKVMDTPDGTELIKISK